MAQAPPIQWQKCYGGTMGDHAKSIFQTIDSGYIVAGFTTSVDSDVTGLHGSQFDYWIVKISPLGTIQWQKTLGGAASDLAVSIVQTFDTGYAVIGYSNSVDGDITGNHGMDDYWVAKLSPAGSIQWQKSLGGSANDIPKDIRQTADSGFIITGSTNSADGDITSHHDSADCWVIKLSAAGSVQWQKTLGGSRGDGGVSIRQTLDKGYIVACSSNSNDGDVTGNHGDYDVWVVKLSPLGGIQWQRSYGGSGTDYANAIQQTADSGYIVLSSSNSYDGDLDENHGGFDYWLMRLSPAGSIIWQRTYGGTATDFATSLDKARDSGYILGGITFSNDSDVTGFRGTSDMWIVKVSSSGDLEWQRCLGGTSYDGAEYVLATQDSAGYIAAGYVSSGDGDATGYRGNVDFWVVKLGYDISLTDTTGTINNVNTISSTPLFIHPNPTTGTLYISGTAYANVRIYNTIGQLVIDAHSVGKVSLDGLPAGVYLAKCSDAEGRLLKQEKIIKL